MSRYNFKFTTSSYRGNWRKACVFFSLNYDY